MAIMEQKQKSTIRIRREKKNNKEKEQLSKGEEIAFAGIAYELSLDKRKNPNQINGRKVRL